MIALTFHMVEDMVRDSRVVMISVTPQRFAEAAEIISHAITPDHLIVSVMAGVLVEMHDQGLELRPQLRRRRAQGAMAWLPSAKPNSGMPYSAVGNPFGFTGHVYLPAVGLYHTWGRILEPTLGRWLQRDPIEYEAGSVNLYEYVLSNPFNWIDPLGLIQRDKNGNIIIKETNQEGKAQILQDPSDPNSPPARNSQGRPIRARLRRVQLFADDGRPIDAYKRQDGHPGYETDCHGQTFADGEVWIDNEEVEDILEGDDYQPVLGPLDKPRKNDVVIIRDSNGRIIHSVTVTEVDKDTGDIKKVWGEGGVQVTPRETTLAGSWPAPIESYDVRRRYDPVPKPGEIGPPAP